MAYRYPCGCDSTHRYSFSRLNNHDRLVKRFKNPGAPSHSRKINQMTDRPPPSSNTSNNFGQENPSQNPLQVPLPHHAPVSIPSNVSRACRRDFHIPTHNSGLITLNCGRRLKPRLLTQYSVLGTHNPSPIFPSLNNKNQKISCKNPVSMHVV